MRHRLPFIYVLYAEAEDRVQISALTALYSLVCNDEYVSVLQYDVSKSNTRMTSLLDVADHQHEAHRC